MGKTKIQTEETLYKRGDKMSINLEKKFDRHNYKTGEHRKAYKEKKYSHITVKDKY
jgi:hypothetical protein